MSRYEFAPINFGSNPESQTAAKRNFGIRRRENCWLWRIFERLPTRRRLFCPVSKKAQACLHVCLSRHSRNHGNDRELRRFFWTAALIKKLGGLPWPRAGEKVRPRGLFCSRTTLQDDRAAQGKTIWKAHSIRVANTADKRASPNRRGPQQRRRKIRKRKRCVIRSVRLPLVPALCIRLPT